ncbi:hypothetical protein OROGR_023697 [Orobanche gracilis]
MEIIPYGRRIKRQWKKRLYNKLSATNDGNVKIVKLGTSRNRDSKPRHPWRLRLAPKLRLARLQASPLKLWCRFKNAYMKMMLKLANTGNVFGEKRIPDARDLPTAAYSRTEFENRLVLEIYKSMVASLELGYNQHHEEGASSKYEL